MSEMQHSLLLYFVAILLIVHGLINKCSFHRKKLYLTVTNFSRSHVTHGLSNSEVNLWKTVARPDVDNILSSIVTSESRHNDVLS